LAEDLDRLSYRKKQALEILDKIIANGDTRGYGVNAKVYTVAWSRSREMSQKSTLATLAQPALLNWMEHRDARCGLDLEDRLWLGRMSGKSLERAKACWLLAAEWGERLKALRRLANAVSTRDPKTRWKNNPDGDASVCLKYALETTEPSTRSACLLGLFYYLRPSMFRPEHEHLGVWTAEPGDWKASE